MDEQIEFLKLLATRLGAKGIEFMVTGSSALAFHARPRMTRDVDLVVACRPGEEEALLEAFRPDCYVDEDALREAVATRGMFNVIHQEWLIKADIIIQKDTIYRKTEMQRSRVFMVDGTPLPVVSVEDLILSKLLWMRDTDSELQRRDVESLLRSNPELDGHYLEHWAGRLDLLDLLARVRRR